MSLLEVILFVCSICTVSFAIETEMKINTQSFSDLKNIKLKLPEKTLDELQKMIQNDNIRKITTNLNEFVDKLLGNMEQSAVCHALDPFYLPNIEESFLSAHITLEDGSLSGIGKMHRYGNTEVSYNTNTRRISLAVEVEFELLLVKYNYKVKLLLLKPSGGLEVLLHEFRFRVVLDFDFDTYQASVGECSILNSGFINLKFKGDVLNEIISIISSFVTIVLQPVIKGILNVVINNVLHNVIEAVNSFIYNFLNPTYETIASIMALVEKVFN